MKQPQSIAVSLPTLTRRKLFRASEPSGFSVADLIRRAVEKQLPLWEKDGQDAVAARAGRARKLPRLASPKRKADFRQTFQSDKTYQSHPTNPPTKLKKP